MAHRFALRIERRGYDIFDVANEGAEPLALYREGHPAMIAAKPGVTFFVVIQKGRHARLHSHFAAALRHRNRMVAPIEKQK
jgi:hypothetical protein